MNKIILTLAIASTIGVFAAPKPPAKKGPPQKTTTKQVILKPGQVQPGPGKKVIVQEPTRPGEHKKIIIKHEDPKPRPVMKPNTKVIRREAPHRIEASHRNFHQRGAGSWVEPRSHSGFHANRPHGARFWDRPPMPPPMAGALSAWSWVATPWSYTVDGAYYYGEGYYFDGYNYCYNGGYHLTPPPVLVTTPAVAAPVVTTPVVTTPVVTQPVVTTPVVTTPVVPPPPPPRRRGLLNMLFGD